MLWNISTQTMFFNYIWNTIYKTLNTGATAIVGQGEAEKNCELWRIKDDLLPNMRQSHYNPHWPHHTCHYCTTSPHCCLISKVWYWTTVARRRSPSEQIFAQTYWVKSEQNLSNSISFMAEIGDKIWFACLKKAWNATKIAYFQLKPM